MTAANNSKQITLALKFRRVTTLHKAPEQCLGSAGKVVCYNAKIQKIRKKWSITDYSKDFISCDPHPWPCVDCAKSSSCRGKRDQADLRSTSRFPGATFCIDRTDWPNSASFRLPGPGRFAQLLGLLVSALQGGDTRPERLLSSPSG